MGATGFPSTTLRSPTHIPGSRSANPAFGIYYYQHADEWLVIPADDVAFSSHGISWVKNGKRISQSRDSDSQGINDAPAIFGNGRDHGLCPGYIQIADPDFGTEKQYYSRMDTGIRRVRPTHASKEPRPPPCRSRSRFLCCVQIPCSNDTYMLRRRSITYL